MNLTKLEKEFPRFLTHMRENGYAESYVTHIIAEFNWLMSNEAEFESYQAALEERLKNTSLLYAVHRRSFFGMFQKFEENGELPDGRNNNPLSIRDAYRKLLPVFKSFVDEYVGSVNNGVSQEETIYCRKCSLSKFLLSLQEQGCETLEDIEQKHVLAVFPLDENAPFKNHPKMRELFCIFNSVHSESEEEARRIALLIPPAKKVRKNIQYLNDEEVKKIHDVLFDESNGLALRERAIGKILYYTGMRASDVAGLKFSDIDWERDRIHLIQKKTSAPLTLPLPPVVGNAICDYILKERPESDEKHIFLTRSKYPHRMEGADLIPVADIIYREAGIRQKKGSRKGTHIFRHRLATHLAGANISRTVISDTLGHTNPKSIEAYLSADIVNLRKCALSIEDFPVREASHE